MNRVIDLQQRAPEWALARLNRVTGLTFSRLPVSLLPKLEAGRTNQRAELVRLA